MLVSVVTRSIQAQSFVLDLESRLTVDCKVLLAPNVPHCQYLQHPEDIYVTCVCLHHVEHVKVVGSTREEEE